MWWWAHSNAHVRYVLLYCGLVTFISSRAVKNFFGSPVARQVNRLADCRRCSLEKRRATVVQIVFSNLTLSQTWYLVSSERINRPVGETGEWNGPADSRPGYRAGLTYMNMCKIKDTACHNPGMIINS